MLNSVSDHQIERPALVSLIAPTLPLAGQVIVVSGDWLYVQRFFADLAASVMDFAKGWSLLLVVFDATPACVEEFLQKHGVHEFVSVVYAEARPQNLDIRQLIFSREPAYLRMLCVNQYVDRFFKRQLVKLGIRLSLNWECLFSKEALDRRESQTVYASARFVLPAKFFSECSSVLLVDMDSLFTPNFADWIGEQDKSGAVLSSNGWSRYLAGIVLLRTRTEVHRFFTVSRKLFNVESELGRIAWGVDQLVLDRLMHELDCQPLSNAMSFTVSGNSGQAIVSWKGRLKNARD